MICQQMFSAVTLGEIYNLIFFMFILGVRSNLYHIHFSTQWKIIVFCFCIVHEQKKSECL